MEALILTLALASCGQDDVIANIIKARIAILKLIETPEPPLADPLEQTPIRSDPYSQLRAKAIKENKALVVLVGKKNWIGNDQYYIVYECEKFPNPKNKDELLTDAVIVSKPERGELWYLTTLRGPPTWPMIDKALCPDGKCVPPKR